MYLCLHIASCCFPHIQSCPCYVEGFGWQNYCETTSSTPVLYCDNLTDGIENSVLANDCGSEFGSVCRVECNTGYRAVGIDTFTCVSVNDTVEWKNNVYGGTVVWNW